jgi:hypothetical protein
MGKDRRCYFTVVKGQAILPTEIGTVELILLIIVAVLFLSIGSIP